MDKCRGCEAFQKCTAQAYGDVTCRYLRFSYGMDDRTEVTNADRIRAMSDEDLANWLARTQYANMMEAAEIFGAQLLFEEETLNGSEKECLEWLQQPAEPPKEEI